MPQIVFPTSSAPAFRPYESAGRLINAFVDKTEGGAPGRALWRRSPGLSYLTSAPTPHTRGFQEYIDSGQLAVGSMSWATAFWVTDDKVSLLSIIPGTGAYNVFPLGDLPGTDFVTMARNNATTRQAVVVTAEGAFQLIPSGPPIPYVAVDTDLPPFPTSVCAMDGYFVFSYQNGMVLASKLNSLEIDPLRFNIEQGQAVLRVVKFSGRLYAFGDKWTGVYRNAGTIPFPFLREATIPRGLFSTHAIAGWEPGWPNELIWVGDDCIVYKLNGYTPVPISNDSVSRFLEESRWRYSERPPIHAFVYTAGRNAFWVLSAPHGTWEYNATTGQWCERRSRTRTIWRGCKSILGRRGWLIGDAFTGNLYFSREQTFCEENASSLPYNPTQFDPMKFTVESGVMTGLPSRLVIPRASFNITAGVGEPSGAFGERPGVPNPTVKISWSLDGGATWGVPVTRRLGPPGETRFYPSVICSGLSRGQGIRYRLEVEDDVHVGLSGGEIDTQARAP